MNDLTPIYGIAWFQPEQWNRLLEISVDRNQLEDTHEEWKAHANKTIHDLRAEGKKIKKVGFDLEEFLYWCNSNYKESNSSARAEYVAFLMKRKHEKS